LVQPGNGPVPERIAVRMHRVGFGDCFLVSFTYAVSLDDGRRERHVLIDFGTTSLPTGLSDLTGVARAIGERTSGEIDVVVLSHRHRDHLSAFAQAEIVNLLQATRPPTLVVRPWTEDPNADANFTGEAGPGASSLAFVQALADGRAFAAAMANQVTTASARGTPRELRQLAVTQLANEGAVTQLDAWAGSTGEYLHYGASTTIGGLVPGVTVRVLGPPTIEQHKEVSSQRETDPGEFWMLYKRLVDELPIDVLHALADSRTARGPEPVGSGEGTAPVDGPTRWLTEHLDRQQLGSFLRIVRIMDDVLNNTSLILLFEVEGTGGTKRLLFPGDAQIENWEYSLKVVDVQDNVAALRQVDLYKVGHHGSRNATPRTLFNLWTEPGTAEHKMVAMMSTKSGVHGQHVETAVPRETLVDALRDRTELFNSEAQTDRWVEVVADMASPNSFTKP
jgi:hypothetical protein